MEPSRLLRRALLVAAVAVAGWLLSAVFAGAASADELSDDGTQAYRPSGLLDDLVGGVTDVVGGMTDMVGGMTDRVPGVTEALVHTPFDMLPPIPEQPQNPVDDFQSILPGSASGSASTDRNDAAPARAVEIVVAPAVAVPATPAPVAPIPVAPPKPPAPARTPAGTVPATPAAPPATTAGTGGPDTEHAGRGSPEPDPVKTPSAPGSSGTTVSTAHDNTGGARGTHGVLPAQAILHPADAGFTSRSLAVDGAGRAAGLPASSPD
ncbi:hypothetical protein [Actinophytocola sp.]|uniref:hypothetical protein n=1 Tax=Actinophytocola sp. TaxID=1872138 RepID=UPI003899D0F9